MGPVGTELFHAHGRTDRLTKLTGIFRNFASAPKNRYIINRSVFVIDRKCVACEVGTKVLHIV
jgi:hypothetical protein